MHFLERISDSLVAREVAVTAWKLQLHRETISLPLSPALYLAYRPHPFTRPCTLSLLVFVSRISTIISQLSRSSLFIPNNVRRSHRFSSEDEKSRPRNIEITGSSHQSTEPFCALSNTNSAWVDVAGRLPDFIPGYTLSSQSTIFLTSSSRRSYTAI